MIAKITIAKIAVGPLDKISIKDGIVHLADVSGLSFTKMFMKPSYISYCSKIYAPVTEVRVIT